MSDGNTRLGPSECLAFPPLIVSGVSAGQPADGDALGLLRALGVSYSLLVVFSAGFAGSAVKRDRNRSVTAVISNRRVR